MKKPYLIYSHSCGRNEKENIEISIPDFIEKTIDSKIWGYDGVAERANARANESTLVLSRLIEVLVEKQTFSLEDINKIVGAYGGDEAITLVK